MDILWGILVLCGVYLGYLQGKGADLKIDLRQMKRVTRSDEQEAELIDKLQKVNKRNG